MKSCFINPKHQCFHLHTLIRTSQMHFQTFLLQKLRTSVIHSPQYLPFYHKHSHTRTHIVDSLCLSLLVLRRSKSCELDPVPTSLMKQNIDVFAKYITIIVNRSLSSGCFPDSQKIAHVKPLLKKPNLDKEVFKNYRPAANLKYLGKTIERVVSSRISDHVRANNLSDTFQSAYKPFHGTETALLRVNNDILSAMDDGKITALVLLDLSAAFDTVDHKILLSRLQHNLGLHDIALDWCKSYLLNRPQHVCIGNAISKPVILDYSVPPRLCARPTVVYCLYLSDSWYHFEVQFKLPCICWWHAALHYFQIFSRTCWFVYYNAGEMYSRDS